MRAIRKKGPFHAVVELYGLLNFLQFLWMYGRRVQFEMEIGVKELVLIV